MPATRRAAKSAWWFQLGFNPSENISPNGNLPQIGVKIKNIWNHHLENGFPRYDVFFRLKESDG